MNDIKELEQEIKLLKKRIEILENNETKRKLYRNIHLIFKICLFLLFIYGVYQGYEYITKNIPNIIENRVREINILKK